MPTIKIPITTDFIELNQLLKLAGLASSGGGGKALVAAGGISVDGAAELRKTAKIRAGQVVKCGEARIRVIAAGATAETGAATGAHAGVRSGVGAGVGAGVRSGVGASVGVGAVDSTKKPTKSTAKRTPIAAPRPAWAGKTIRRKAK